MLFKDRLPKNTVGYSFITFLYATSPFIEIFKKYMPAGKPIRLIFSLLPVISFAMTTWPSSSDNSMLTFLIAPGNWMFISSCAGFGNKQKDAAVVAFTSRL